MQVPSCVSRNYLGWTKVLNSFIELVGIYRGCIWYSIPYQYCILSSVSYLRYFWLRNNFPWYGIRATIASLHNLSHHVFFLWCIPSIGIPCSLSMSLVAMPLFLLFTHDCTFSLVVAFSLARCDFDVSMQMQQPSHPSWCNSWYNKFFRYRFYLGRCWKHLQPNVNISLSLPFPCPCYSSCLRQTLFGSLQPWKKFFFMGCNYSCLVHGLRKIGLPHYMSRWYSSARLGYMGVFSNVIISCFIHARALYMRISLEHMTWLVVYSSYTRVTPWWPLMYVTFRLSRLISKIYFWPLGCSRHVMLIFYVDFIPPLLDVYILMLGASTTTSHAFDPAIDRFAYAIDSSFEGHVGDEEANKDL